MNILFTVCGRAGSKGIKGKNVRDFNGFPLSYYTFSAIELYLNDNREDRIDVALNTDSERLIEITENNPFVKAEIIRREPSLGGDTVPKPAVILSTLQQMEQRTGIHYDMVVDLDITSPLRTAGDIKALIDVQKEKHPDITFSVTDSRRNPYFNMVFKGEKGYKKVIDSDYVARQQAPEIFDMNASLYAYSPAFLGRCRSVLDGYAEVIKMYDTGILDLDRADDFELMEVIAEYLFSQKDGFREVYQNMRNKLGDKD